MSVNISRRMSGMIFPVAAMFLAVLLLASPFSVECAADPYRDAAVDLTQKLVTLFPPAEGYIVSLPAGEVYVDLAEAELMRPGMELHVYREGDDIVHPVTKDVLGKYEETVGYLVIRDVKEKYSVGRPVEGAGELKPGDKVRISARPRRGLLLFGGQSPALEAGRMAEALTAAISDSQRFRLQDEPEWFPRLKEMNASVDEVLADEALLRRLGGEARADLLFVIRPPGGEEPLLTLDVISLWTGRKLAGHCDGVPELCAVSPHVGVRQHGVRPEAA